MRPLQDDMIQDEMLLSVDEAYYPANQADAVFNASPVSGINDSSYNSFPTSPSYMQGGFVPNLDEPRYYAPNPVYEQPYQPPYQEPISVIDEPSPPYLPFPIKEIPPAYYVPRDPYYPPQYAPLPIEDFRPPYFEQPYQPYRPPYEQPIYEQPIPPQYYPVDPIDPIFLLPINPNIPLPIRQEPIQQEPTPTPTPTPTPVEPTPVDAIKTGVMPPEYKADVDPITVTPPVNTPVLQSGKTPETPALPTKAVSKDLKPYIIAGIAVIGILIASRLLSKK
jgi:hypothetical protein